MLVVVQDTFLKYVKNSYPSYQVYGVEPNRFLRDEASKNSGAIIKKETLDALPFQDNYFDVITCYDVLEHSMKIGKNIQELKRVLKQGGALFVQAPNYISLMAYLTGNQLDWWCISDHVLHFSHESLRTNITKNSFTVIHSYTYEDTENFLSNIKGILPGNYMAKAFYYMLIPVLLLLEWIAWKINHGGLNVVIARK